MPLFTLKCHKTLVIKITFIKSWPHFICYRITITTVLFSIKLPILSVISVIYLTRVHKYQESLNIFIYYFNLFLKDAGFHLAPVIRNTTKVN